MPDMVPHSMSGCMWSLSCSLSRVGGTLGLGHSTEMQAQEQHPWGPQDCRDKPAARAPRQRWAVAVETSLAWGPWSDLASRSLKPLASLPCGAPSASLQTLLLRTGLVGKELNAV